MKKPFLLILKITLVIAAIAFVLSVAVFIIYVHIGGDRIKK